MGTRADFYIGRGKQAQWLGSIAWDGYPGGIPKGILTLTDKEKFENNVEVFIGNREDGTRPKDGWPWPWEDSQTTDYAYAFDDGKVWASSFGNAWFDPLREEPGWCNGDVKQEFPDMQSSQNVTFGQRSGLIVLGVPAKGGDK